MIHPETYTPRVIFLLILFQGNDEAAFTLEKSPAHT